MIERLGHPRAPHAVVAFALLLALPSFAIGFFADDYLFIAALEQRLAFNPAWWDLYRFTPVSRDALRAQIAEGHFPWWTAPDFHVHLLRPLSSALLALDHAVFGRHALGWHLHSWLWYAALLAAAGAWFRSILPATTAALALLLFALSDANVFPFAWLSARYGLQAATCVALGTTAHVRARRDGWRPGTWLAPIVLALGLLAGESALGGFAFAIAYDLFAASDLQLRARLRRTLPYVALVLAYLAVYASFDGGARASGGYISPIAEPGRFAAAAALRVPLLLGDAIAGIPAELANTGFTAVLAVLGALATSLFALYLRACTPVMPPADVRASRWLALCGLMALLPATGGFPGARELLIANLGFAPVMAIALRAGLVDGRWGRARRVASGSLAVVHIAFAPFNQLLTQESARTMANASEAIARAIVRESASGLRVIVLAASDPMVATYPPLISTVTSNAPRPCWTRLSGARADLIITRTGTESFALALRDDTFLRAPFETLYRSPSRPAGIGDGALTCGVKVSVAAIERGRPARIAVASDAPLEAPGITWLAWRDGALRPITFPPIGGRMTVAWSPGPSRLY